MHSEHRTIGELAYRLWQARGCPEGTAEKDWLDAEKQLRAAQRANDARAESRASASDTTDRSLQDTFPASDPPASQGPDEPPSNADAKWKAAGASRTDPSRTDPSRTDPSRVDVSRVEVSRADAPRADISRADASRTRAPARPRRSKSTPGKPSADPPS